VSSFLRFDSEILGVDCEFVLASFVFNVVVLRAVLGSALLPFCFCVSFSVLEASFLECGFFGVF
jgi:hypothetical protein